MSVQLLAFANNSRRATYVIIRFEISQITFGEHILSIRRKYRRNLDDSGFMIEHVFESNYYDSEFKDYYTECNYIRIFK